MKFQPEQEQGGTQVVFIEGSLSRCSSSELSVPYGTTKSLTRRAFITLMRRVVVLAKQNNLKAINIRYTDIASLAPSIHSPYEVGKIAGTAFVMANYEYNTHKTPPKEGFSSVEIMGITDTPAEGKEGFWYGYRVATEVNSCRDLANTPGGEMTPQSLADAAQRAIQGTKATAKILGVKEMQELGMGAILGIGKGSNEEPRFIIIEYWGGDTSKKPLVLVGKGVTFDTGGLNIKTGDGMYEMHMDMSGGAAVISAIALATKLELKANVVALIPAVENSPSGNSVRPGDILTSLSGKTIEILNTDAEGRVILADGITYAKRYDPAMVVDVATLTGAALIALGVQASAFMTNEPERITEIMELAEESGDYLWPFPVWEEYEDMVKGTFGDIPNISSAGNSRYGGVIAGGMFLREFAKELTCPWIHIDMAPRMTSAPNEFLAKGAAGAPVRFLIALIEKHAQ